VVILTDAGVASARLDAELLLAAALRADRTSLHVRPETVPAAAELDAFTAMIQRRALREPLAYIIGHKEFWSLDFEVTPAVLIPRPETEVAVEAALAILRVRGPEAMSICDVGTGSGCIAIALAHALSSASVVAADVSRAALEVAERNATRHGVRDRIDFVQSDLLAAVRGRHFDLIISNPPYVAAEEMAVLEPEPRREPELALNGGPGGLECIRWLLAEAAEALVPGGWLVMEIGADQATVVQTMAAVDGYSSARIAPDYAGAPRVLVAQVS
jgi:release factor glutamine methyltransferase